MTAFVGAYLQWNPKLDGQTITRIVPNLGRAPRHFTRQSAEISAPNTGKSAEPGGRESVNLHLAALGRSPITNRDERSQSWEEWEECIGLVESAWKYAVKRNATNKPS
jgi:hypothetical protein